jgi:hypothetical protein
MVEDSVGTVVSVVSPGIELGTELGVVGGIDPSGTSWFGSLGTGVWIGVWVGVDAGSSGWIKKMVSAVMRTTAEPAPIAFNSSGRRRGSFHVAGVWPRPGARRAVIVSGSYR